MISKEEVIVKALEQGKITMQEAMELIEKLYPIHTLKPPYMGINDYLLSLIPIAGAVFYSSAILPIMGTRAYRTFWYYFMLTYHLGWIIVPAIILNAIKT